MRLSSFFAAMIVAHLASNAFSQIGGPSVSVSLPTAELAVSGYVNNYPTPPATASTASTVLCWASAFCEVPVEMPNAFKFYCVGDIVWASVGTAGEFTDLGAVDVASTYDVISTAVPHVGPGEDELLYKAVASCVVPGPMDRPSGATHILIRCSANAQDYFGGNSYGSIFGLTDLNTQSAYKQIAIEIL